MVCAGLNVTPNAVSSGTPISTDVSFSRLLQHWTLALLSFSRVARLPRNVVLACSITLRDSLRRLRAGSRIFQSHSVQLTLSRRLRRTAAYSLDRLDKRDEKSIFNYLVTLACATCPRTLLGPLLT